MLADNPQFERMFKDRSTVNFLECGDKMGGNKMKKQSPGGSSLLIVSRDGNESDGIT